MAPTTDSPAAVFRYAPGPMARVHNFNAGPAALPIEALELARQELVDFEGTGMSILEHSHREPPYEKVHREAMSLLRELLAIPDTHDILLLQGGARQQFALVPMNLLRPGKSADYTVTGNWAELAHEEASLVGTARIAASTKTPEGRFVRVPEPSELKLDPEAAYLHITSNNTLFGTQWASYPDSGKVPLVVDATSDICTRAIDWSKVAVMYAGAQKNIGPAGVTVVIARKDLIEGGRTDIPAIFRWSSFAKSESLYNTPPTFSIYMMRNTLRVLRDEGGVPALVERTAQKSALVYATADARADFYRCPVEKGSRSKTNVVFRLPTPELEKKFLGEATNLGLVGLKGHRSVGGVRASLYAAVGAESVERLVSFMESFAKGA